MGFAYRTIVKKNEIIAAVSVPLTNLVLNDDHGDVHNSAKGKQESPYVLGTCLAVLTHVPLTQPGQTPQVIGAYILFEFSGCRISSSFPHSFTPTHTVRCTILMIMPCSCRLALS